MTKQNQEQENHWAEIYQDSRINSVKNKMVDIEKAITNLERSLDRVANRYHNQPLGQECQRILTTMRSNNQRVSNTGWGSYAFAAADAWLRPAGENRIHEFGQNVDILNASNSLGHYENVMKSFCAQVSRSDHPTLRNIFAPNLPSSNVSGNMLWNAFWTPAPNSSESQLSEHMQNYGITSNEDKVSRIGNLLTQINSSIYDALKTAVQNNNTNAAAFALTLQGYVPARVDVTKSTLLHIACRNGNVELARMLIEKGADVNAVIFTPRQDFCGWLRDKISMMFGFAPIVGETALHIAEASGDNAMIDLLLNSGAKTDIEYRPSRYTKDQPVKKTNTSSYTYAASNDNEQSSFRARVGSKQKEGSFSSREQAPPPSYQEAVNNPPSYNPAYCATR